MASSDFIFDFVRVSLRQNMNLMDLPDDILDLIFEMAFVMEGEENVMLPVSEWTEEDWMREYGPPW